MSISLTKSSIELFSLDKRVLLPNLFRLFKPGKQDKNYPIENTSEVKNNINDLKLLAFFVIGFFPVTLIGLTAFDVASLKALAISILVPALIVIGILTYTCNDCRFILFKAVKIGVLATFGYDLFRWSFLWMGWMHVDPIPHIGSALGISPNWLAGYTWRYLGNGTGLALSFLVLRFRSITAGLAYGLFVCSGLFTVLLFSPHGQEMLFPFTPPSIVMAVVGHLIYGALLAIILNRDAIQNWIIRSFMNFRALKTEVSI